MKFSDLEILKEILVEALERPDYALLDDLVADQFYKHKSATTYLGYEILDHDQAVQFIESRCRTLEEWLDDPRVDDVFHWKLLEHHALVSTHFVLFHEEKNTETLHLGLCELDGRYYLCEGMFTVQ